MKVKIFINYVTADYLGFRIKDIADFLQEKPEIKEVLYWSGDATGNLLEFMIQNIQKCDIVLLMCSRKTEESESQRTEWVGAEFSGKIIIPVFDKIEHVPPLVRASRGVMLDFLDFNESVNQIYNLVLKYYKFNIFLSYSTLDSELFNIAKISSCLEQYSEIDNVFYWEKDSGQDIVEYIEKNLEHSEVFVNFCIQNSKNSKSVELERKAAIQLSQAGKIRIIPVFLDPSDIPILISSKLGAPFLPDNFDEFIENLYQETLRR